MLTNGAAPRRNPLAADAATASAGGVLPLYAATLFLSALLLFSVQPMFTKMVLPLLGGSPGVWNTAMVFFQAALLAGYAYAHVTTRLFGLRRQTWLHLGVLAVAFAVLPVTVAAGWTPPTEAAPIAWLIALFTVSVGLPFFAVSATAPLLQKWFADTDHSAARDPYFLYGASNLGSILALLGYPVIVEPLLSGRAQSLAWSWGYGLLVVLIAACALSLRRNGDVGAEDRAAGARAEDAVDWRRRLHWLALAFAPSSLLLAVTAHITADVAAAPLLWVIPLTLYLLTFVLIFSRRPLLRHAWMVKLQPFVVLPLALFFPWNLTIWVVLPLHVLAFFVTAMVCHGELARRRPATSHLTEFYLWMSIGGVLGGVFNALIAPSVFDAVYEYPIAIALACLLRPRLDGGGGGRFARWTDLVAPALILAIVVPTLGRGLRPSDIGLAATVLLYVTIGLLMYGCRLRPLRFGLAMAAVLAATAVMPGALDVLARERSFFGVYRVKSDEGGRFNVLVNGTTVHGAQNTDPALRREPLTYYHRGGPLGQLFAALDGTRALARVGAVGLGTGAAACYRKPGESWTFYEIDPTVARLARDTRFFHYLADCAPEAEVVFGDARLSLARAPDRHFDLLILDAFSSDAIPAHLLTREALALYMAKLAPGGIVMFHISNRNLELAPVLENLIADAGLAGRIQRDRRDADDENGETYKRHSTWVAIARKPEDLAMLEGDSRWQQVAPHPGAGVWTDDFSNIFGALKW
ncbi:MAG: spermidine synthase [Alphaproteobacteria bacterium]